MDYLNHQDIKSTRKDHQCYGCTDSIPKGSPARSITHADEGTIQTLYYCEVCQHCMDEDYFREVFDDGEFSVGEIREYANYEKIKEKLKLEV